MSWNTSFRSKDHRLLGPGGEAVGSGCVVGMRDCGDLRHSACCRGQMPVHIVLAAYTVWAQ